MRTQRASLVPFFMAANKAVRVRGLVDDTLEECGVAVMDDDNPRVVYTGLGHEVFPLVFKLVKHGPTIEVSYEDLIELDDLYIR